MKKVGIVTFHRALNYGAVLQSYALQKTVSSLGAECEIVDYICPKITADYKPFRIYKNDLLKSFAKSCVMVRRRAKRRDAFKSFFNNYLVKSKKSYTPQNIGELKNDYDLFISGNKLGKKKGFKKNQQKNKNLPMTDRSIHMRQALPFRHCPMNLLMNIKKG